MVRAHSRWMRYLLRHILAALLSAFCAPREYYLTGHWPVQGVCKLAAVFCVLVSHIRASLLPRKRVGAQPESIAVHRTMRASFKSRVSPEIIVGVCGKVSGFLGFLEFVISRLFCGSTYGHAYPSHNRARPERMPMANTIACAHPR